MKRFYRLKTLLVKACMKIHLIDKCLMIIMFFLLLQSSFSLFFEAASATEINTIDIIVRTATASIFGYFLSSNFMRHDHEKEVEKQEQEKDSNKLYPTNRLQIIITTAIAIFCLLVLIIIRNISGIHGVHFTASAQATISQFRDLISGCIGFLIGVPTTKK